MVIKDKDDAPSLAQGKRGGCWKQGGVYEVGASIIRQFRVAPSGQGIMMGDPSDVQRILNWLVTTMYSRHLGTSRLPTGWLCRPAALFRLCLKVVRSRYTVSRMSGYRCQSVLLAAYLTRCTMR